MLTKARKDKADRIKQVIAKLGKKKTGRVSELIELFYARVAPEDIVSASLENLQAAPASLTKAAATRKSAMPVIRAWNPDGKKDNWTTPYTVIEIINEDE